MYEYETFLKNPRFYFSGNHMIKKTSVTTFLCLLKKKIQKGKHSLKNKPVVHNKKNPYLSEEKKIMPSLYFIFLVENAE